MRTETKFAQCKIFSEKTLPTDCNPLSCYSTTVLCSTLPCETPKSTVVVCYLKGRQEDAEEFQAVILNGLHEEMTRLFKQIENGSNHTLSNASSRLPDVDSQVEVGLMC